jgi:deoxyribodipyrimidine photo-lyase
VADAPCIVWFRHDLRLSDNRALDAAVARGGPVVPLFVWAPQEAGRWPPGAASRWWLHHSLEALQQRLADVGSPLIVRGGASLDVLESVARETGADAVYWNRDYEPELAARDRAVEEELARGGIDARTFNSRLLFEPWEVATGAGDPYRVFTPFWKACRARPEPERPLPAPRALTAPVEAPESISVADLELLPKIDWTRGIRASWRPGEYEASRRLGEFVGARLEEYSRSRDIPGFEGTSRLSPHLHFGELGPRQVWHAVRSAQAATGESKSAEKYLAEIGWREFAFHLLHHYPSLPDTPLRESFNSFPWRVDRKGLRAWQRGRTGFPIVDAGMRELWSTGWMHNRVRMIVASFLVKDLMIPWQKGAEWFWDTLVDADLASNTQGWQWTAGCGADAAPYFRVFNPVTQGRKFDPEGAYVRRWVPELEKLPSRFVHEPWAAPDEVLERAGVRLGRHYPRPLVDHALARQRALDAFAALPGR